MFNEKIKSTFDKVNKLPKEEMVVSIFDLIDNVMEQDGVFDMSDEEFDEYCNNLEERFGKGNKKNKIKEE